MQTYDACRAQRIIFSFAAMMIFAHFRFDLGHKRNKVCFAQEMESLPRNGKLPGGKGGDRVMQSPEQ